MPNRSDDPSLIPANAALLESLYEAYRARPESVTPAFRQLFEELDSVPEARTAPHIPKLRQSEAAAIEDLNERALLLIQAYRRHGHFFARTDPLGLKAQSGLDPADYGISPDDMQREVSAPIADRWVTAPMSEIVRRLESTYCSSIGAEFFYIRDEARRSWLIENLESERHNARLSRNVKLMIFEKLVSSEGFERFIATRYPGKKRFSLEGGESLIPTLASVVENAGTYDIRQIVLGMAHRGRLNVLANVMGKDPALIFAEFNENVDTDDVAGDVKYHLGYSSDVPTLTGSSVHLSLAFNPSHLEVINPVILGSVRARQTRGGDTERTRYLPVILHGDAAFSGQGINYECLNMSGLDGYRVGGALHIIVNNQIGFTTLPEEGRSTPYCTDLAKMLQAPIFHVNGNDPEACYRAIMLCLAWRQAFRTDIFLDLVCYRRWGHNETDEPAFTQPTMYERIRGLKTPMQLYEENLRSEGTDPERLEAIKASHRETLEKAFARVQTEELKVQVETLQAQWSGFQKASGATDPETGVSRERLEHIAEQITSVPADFTPHAKLARLLEQRRAMVFEGQPIDWGMAENLAYGTLLMEGYSIRISGQDARRGTFSHRHAALYDQKTGRPHLALAGLNPARANFEVINSLLSETAVLGFEFGYSLADPRTLVIWEAQFGDFVNGAQVVIDQFISSCEAKWNRMSGLVMLLPHGYEGQGPEHSSARLERFLQLCSLNNIQVCNLTTPAQYFHLIRRQIKRNFRKPLVVMSPKSLLRLPEAASSTEQLIEGSFAEVIDDPDARPDLVDRLIFCSGKLYYEMTRERAGRAINNVAIVRVEQLYPYPVRDIQAMLEKYSRAREVAWAQEEPRNQGAWIYMEHRLSGQIGREQELLYFGRPPSPSPATGYYKVHQREQSELIDLGLRVSPSVARR